MPFADKIDELYFVDAEYHQEQNYSKEYFSFSEGFFDWRVFLTFFKVKDNDLFSRERDERLRILTQIKNCLYRYSDLGVEILDSSILDYVPIHLIKKLAEKNFALWRAQYNLISSRKNYSEFLSYYAKNKENFDSIFKIKSSFSFGDIEFDFAENFRFKPKHNSFNAFSLKKENRDIIAPNDNDFFVYAFDYKQFEFRTFLSLIDYDKEIFSASIYDYLSSQLSTKSDDVKVEIIAWLYSSRNVPMLDAHMSKNKILSRIKDGCFEGSPSIWVGESVAPHKAVHSVVQTKSQLFYLGALSKILKLLEGKKSKFVYPLHDTMIFFIHKNEIQLIDEIQLLAETDIYKIKNFIGKNYRDIEEI